jgi:hypothetical protein
MNVLLRSLSCNRKGIMNQRLWPALLLILGAASIAPAAPVLSMFDPSGSFSAGPPPVASSVDPLHGTFIVLFQVAGSSFGTGPSDLYGFNFDLTYNPAVVQAVSIQEQGYFAQNGLGLGYNLVQGLITNINDVVAGPGPGENLQDAVEPFAADTLFAITFEAVGQGQTTITIPDNADLFLSDSNGNLTTPIVGSDNVIVYPVTGPPTAPEPAAIALAGGGLVLLSLWARRLRTNG